MTYLLEYNRSTHQFHYNHLNKDERTFHSALFSYGWSPICILPEELSLDQDFIDFTNHLAKKKMGYKDMYRLVNMWVINWMQGRKLLVNQETK